MQIRKVLASVVMILGLAVVANAQKVEVSQEFIDSAKRSFTEVVLLRQAVVSLESAAKAKDETVAAKNQALAAKDETIKVREEQIEMYRNLKCDETKWFWGAIKNKRCH